MESFVVRQTCVTPGSLEGGSGGYEHPLGLRDEGGESGTTYRYPALRRHHTGMMTH